MRIDDYAFEQTAYVVWHMNDSAQEMYDSPRELEQFMISMAYQYAHKTTSFSTGGFHLSFCKSSVDSEDVYVTASVQSYTALKYMEAVTNRLDTIRSLAA
jgi:hypothetical protein